MSEWIENQMAGMTKNEERLCDEIDARRWVEKILSFTKSELEDSKREKLVLDAEIEKLAAEVKSLKAEREHFIKELENLQGELNDLNLAPKAGNEKVIAFLKHDIEATQRDRGVLKAQLDRAVEANTWQIEKLKRGEELLTRCLVFLKATDLELVQDIDEFLKELG